jgi:hypothetical protein
MVDQTSRSAAKTLITDYFSGAITNDEFLDQFPRRSKDKVLNALYHAFWDFAEDLHTHKLLEPVDQQTTEIIQRCRLFLDSELEYEWKNWLETVVDSVQTVVSGRSEITSHTGDRSVWPFFREQDYALAKQSFKSQGNTRL